MFFYLDNSDDLGTAPGCQSEERDKKRNTPALEKSLQVEGGRNSLLNSGSKQNERSVCSAPKSGALMKESQILMDSLTTEGLANIRGLNTAPIKVEGTSPPVSTAESVSAVFHGDNTQSTNTYSHAAGKQTISNVPATLSHIHNIHNIHVFEQDFNISGILSDCFIVFWQIF